MQAEPDFDTTQNITYAAKAAINRDDTKYTAIDGTPEVGDLQVEGD